MNFKKVYFKNCIITILISFIASSCGVKSAPTAPASTAIPSYVGTFLKKPQSPNKPSTKKK